MFDYMFTTKEQKIFKRVIIGSFLLSLFLMLSTFLWNCKINACWTDDWIMVWGIIGYPVFSVMSSMINTVIDFTHMSDGSVIGLSMIILSVAIEFLFFGVALAGTVIGVLRLCYMIQNFFKKNH